MNQNICHCNQNQICNNNCKYAIQYSSMIENIPGAIYRCRILKDYGFVFDFMSQSAQELTGYPASDFINNSVRSFTSIIFPEDRQKVVNALFRGVAYKESFEVEYRINCANGAEKWVSERGKAQYNERGKLLWIDGACFDITAKKKMEEDIIKSEKLKGVLEMSGAVCHEMNQPMTSAMLHLQLLCEELSTDLGENHIYRNDIDVIKKSIEDMSIITKKLMSINRYRTQEYIKGQTIIDIDGSSTNEY
ncbi:MAG: PAS domain-containing protein [Desulfamplus sp.]|nr:PAS domain-containing protein [Desulfamplus sp.]